jgi:hypothetical protein
MARSHDEYAITPTANCLSIMIKSFYGPLFVILYTSLEEGERGHVMSCHEYILYFS